MTDTITKEQARRKYAHVKNPCRCVANHDIGMAYRGSCISPNNPKARYDGSNACPCDFSRGRFNNDIARVECKFHTEYITKSTTVRDMVYEREQQRINQQKWDARMQMLHLGNIGFRLKEWIMNSGIKWKIFTLISIVFSIWVAFFSEMSDIGFFSNLLVAVVITLMFQVIFVFWFIFEAIFKFIKNIIDFILGR